MIGPPVAVPCPSDVDESVQQHERWSLVFVQRVERSSAVTDAGRDQHGAARALAAVDEVERVQSLHELAGFLRARDHVEGAADRVDHGRPDDTDVSTEVPVVPVAGAHHVRVARRNRVARRQVSHPERRAFGLVVGVEGIHAVVHGRDVEHVPGGDLGR